MFPIRDFKERFWMAKVKTRVLTDPTASCFLSKVT